MTIDQVIQNKWVSHYNAVPPTPLLTSDVLKEDNELWLDVQEGMSLALREMRVDQVIILISIQMTLIVNR